MAVGTMRSSGYFFIGVLILTVVAFWRPYVTQLPGDFPIYTHLHAAFMLAWVGLLIVQPFLIRAQRRALHRALGKVSYVLVPAIAWATLSLAHDRLNAAPSAEANDAAISTYLPIAMLALFLFAYVQAIRHRRTQALHARFMACTLLGLVDPIVARLVYFYLPALPNLLMLQLISYVVIVVALGVLIYRERDAKVGRAVFPVMLGVTTIVYGLWFTFAQTDAWIAIMRRFGDLPLT